jgi:hypothetical protein
MPSVSSLSPGIFQSWKTTHFLIKANPFVVPRRTGFQGYDPHMRIYADQHPNAFLSYP